MRAAIRIAPPSVISRVYPTSRASLRIRPITTVANPGGGGTGAAASSRTGLHRVSSSPIAARQWTQFSLVVCELASVAVGDLLEQGVDIGTAGKAARVQ